MGSHSIGMTRRTLFLGGVEPGMPRLPRVWIGFALSGILFLSELADIATETEETTFSPSFFVSIGVFVYWLFCIYSVHRVLRELTFSRYPISPLKASMLHVIPVYDIYWIFRWPSVLSKFVNQRRAAKVFSGSLVSLWILTSILVYKIVDGALGSTLLFAATNHVYRKIQRDMAG